MSNMSYCRFQNTVQDLNDCYHNLEEHKELSENEAKARKRLLKLCAAIADEFQDEIETLY